MNTHHLPRHYYPGHVFIPKNGYYQARRIGLTALRVHRDPLFHKTRLCAQEFAQLARYAKLIRTALCANTNIKANTQRLLGLLNQALQEDDIHIQGSRKLTNAGLEMLEGFNLNPNAAIEQVCKIDGEIIVDPATKQTTVVIPSFVPAYYIQGPAGISHCRIYMVTATLDLDQLLYTSTTEKTSLIPLKRIHIPAVKLVSANNAISTGLTVVALGINWYAPVVGSIKIAPSKIAGPLMITTAF